LIIFLSGLLTGIANLILHFLPLGIFVYILSIIVSVYSFYYFVKKYFAVGIEKSLPIYIVNNIIFGVMAFILVILVRSLLFAPFVISGDSMSPTYKTGDYLFINKFIQTYHRGDVVIYSESDKSYIKRIIGLPSEKIEIHNNTVFINGQELNEPYAAGNTIGDLDITLTSEQYFMMGDNREHSADSRTLGPISEQEIQGKLFKNFGTLFTSKTNP
jgi:signal peptidase I